MDKKLLIEKLCDLCIKEHQQIYRDVFKADIEKVTEQYYMELIRLYNNLTDGEKDTIFKLIKQVEIDTAANILGLLDGVTFLDKQDDEFNLTFKKSNFKLNGDLQDLFLEYVESEF